MNGRAHSWIMPIRATSSCASSALRKAYPELPRAASAYAFAIARIRLREGGHWPTNKGAAVPRRCMAVASNKQVGQPARSAAGEEVVKGPPDLSKEQELA